MRTLAFDGRTGAAGDMICAALVAAGADPDVLDPVEDHLPIRYEIGETTKNGIRATTVDVLLDDGAAEIDAHGGRDEPARSNGDHHHDDHEHAEDHQTHHDDHEHTEDHQTHHDDHEHTTDDHGHAEGAGVHRTYPEVVALVESMGLDPGVEAIALDAFELLGRAEASVHGTGLAETHFHEVGADDAIADVVGAALLFADLDVERIVTTPVAVGGGDVTMSHGIYPVPTPAVVEIAERTDLTMVGGPVDHELLTPTGAAILGAVAEGVDRLPPIDATATGYGAGDATFPEHPNVLRALVGNVDDADGRHADEDHADDADEAHADGDGGHADGSDGTRLLHDDVAVLETNLDDASAEILGGLQETLSRVGARDVTIVPTTMKKSRPGHLVTVICKPADAAAVAERLARETGTLGVRQSGATHRWIAERSIESVTLEIDGEIHEVDVKIAATADGDVYDVSAEYDDAAAVAFATDLPIRDVMRRAEAAIDP